MTKSLAKWITRKFSDRKKVIFLLKEGFQLNDIIGAKEYGIYFVHQRVAELRKKGWVIESIMEDEHVLKTYRFVSEPKPQPSLF